MWVGTSLCAPSAPPLPCLGSALEVLLASAGSRSSDLSLLLALTFDSPSSFIDSSVAQPRQVTLGCEAKKNYQLSSRRVLVRPAPDHETNGRGRLLLVLGRARQVPYPSLHVLGSPQKPIGRTREELRGAPSHRCDT